jgi:hypothetical protein
MFKGANSINPESKNIGKLIKGKMLETSMEELECKHPVSWP